MFPSSKFTGQGNWPTLNVYNSWLWVQCEKGQIIDIILCLWPTNLPFKWPGSPRSYEVSQD